MAERKSSSGVMTAVTAALLFSFRAECLKKKKKKFLLSVRVQSPASIIPRRLFRLCFVCRERGCQPLYLFSWKVSFVDGLFGFLAYADQRQLAFDDELSIRQS